MRRNNRRNNVKRERIIMVASSVFVLAALTMTGLYMKGQEIREQDDGYTLDFTALENNLEDKVDEIIRQQEEPELTQDLPEEIPGNLEDDLDYMPLEAGSGQVEIPGLTDGMEEALTEHIDEKPKNPPKKEQKNDEPEPVQQESDEGAVQETEVQETAAEESATQSVSARELHFSDEDSLLRPVNGDVILPYSMDKSIYFTTLDQYKYNPATIFEAKEGTAVSACAVGKVVSIFKDTEIGRAVTIDMGDGYRIIYGQLTDIQVKEGNYVEAGDKLGTVAAPTKYYVSEGANLYLRMEKDGEPIDAEIRF